MLKKILIPVIFIALAFLWQYIAMQLSLTKIAQWSLYFFAIPIAYFFGIIFSKTTNKLKSILITFVCVLLTILLNKDFQISLITLRIISTIAGGLLTFFLAKYLENKENTD
jgi:hypothetical protein